MTSYIIVGNGPAGLDAAQAIRKNDPEGKISIISKSKNLHYYRPRIVEYITGEVSVDSMTIYKNDFYDKNSIKNILNTEVSKIDPFEKSVSVSDGKKYNYDKLLLATGGKPFMPDITGNQKTGVFTLRGISDADEIIAHRRADQKIVIIGGGLLGIEIANNLLSIGSHVTIIENASHLLPRQLDESAGKLLQRLLEKKGINFITDQSVKSINGGESVDSITLKSDEKIPADIVIVSAGIRPDTSIAKGLDIDINRGFIVNKYFETSIKNIYAAGDAAEHSGFIYGLWLIAKEQGRIAGLNMAGVPTKYNGSIISSTLKVTDIDMYSAGDIHNTEMESHVIETEDSYKKIMLHNTVARAAIVLGDKESAKIARKIMSGKATIDDLLKDR